MQVVAQLKNKTLIFTVFVLIFFLFNQIVLSHEQESQPFLKINGQNTTEYSVPMTSLDNFQLPQDTSLTNYLVGERIDFEIESDKLPVLPSIVANTNYLWDFGDGIKAEGLKTTHTYTKQGSYIVVLQAQYKNDLPQLLQSTLINILPNVDYQLPQSIIEVDSFISKEPLTDPFVFKLGKELTFSGRASKSFSSKIISYEWDFGDGESAIGQEVKHTYQKDFGQFYPVLRIKTEDGFLADSYLEIKKDEGVTNQLETQNYDVKSKIAVAFFVILSLLILFFIVKGLKSRSK